MPDRAHAAGREVRHPGRYPERTYRRRLAGLRAGDEPAKGRWPTPAIDAIEALAAK